MKILKLLDGLRSTMASANGLVAFTCIRALVETVAQAGFAIQQLEPTQVVNTPDEADHENARMFNVLLKTAFSTKVNWQTFVNVDSLRGHAKAERRKATGPWDADHEPPQIAVLMKTLAGVKDVDALYEALCSIVHPNFASQLCLLESINQTTDARGIPWLCRVYGLGPPLGLITSMPGIITDLFDVLRGLLAHWELLRVRLLECESHAQEAARVAIRRHLAARPGAFRPYELCPCGSGKNLKFCCWCRQ